MIRDGATVTFRVEDAPNALITNSRKLECDDCGKEVWVSPMTFRHIQEGLYPDWVECTRCAWGVPKEGWDW